MCYLLYLLIEVYVSIIYLIGYLFADAGTDRPHLANCGLVWDLEG
jgi:hypothetical protein